MAIKGSIVSRPKSKRSDGQQKTSNGQVTVHKKASHFRSVEESRTNYVTLPPGPANFIVRTPYPLPPSKEDESSQ